MDDDEKAILFSLLGKRVIVKLKGGVEYRGLVASVDNNMNMTMDDTEEMVDGEVTGVVGNIPIRINNVLQIRVAENKEDGNQVRVAVIKENVK